MKSMYAVITGDIIDSRSVDAKIWQPVLEKALAHYSKNFDIFRGDSFQVEVEMSNCIELAFYLKAKMRSLESLDVRMGIGIGKVDFLDKHIKNSTGEVFVLSGKAFDRLNKETINLCTPWKNWGQGLTLMLQLAVELANKWTVNMAEVVAIVLENPNANQQELAILLNRKYQSQVSTELTKANWSKIRRVIDFITKELLIKC